MSEFIDLSIVAESLKSKEQRPDFVAKIKELEWVFSALGDLFYARDAVKKLIEIQDDEALHRSFGAALTTHAVILYCRSMGRKNRARPHVDFLQEFSEAELALHDEIVSLRDKAIAHIDSPKGQFAEVWRKHAVSLSFGSGGDFFIGFPSATAIALPDLKKALLELSEKAIATGVKLRKKASDALAEKLIELNMDPAAEEVRALLGACLTSPAEFFETDNVELAEKMFNEPRWAD